MDERSEQGGYWFSTLAVAAIALVVAMFVGGITYAVTHDSGGGPSTAAAAGHPASGRPAAGSPAPSGSPHPSAAPVADACARAVARANASLAYAVRVERALAAHTAVMEKLLRGKINGTQALTMGMPSLMSGARYSAQFDNAYRDYRAVVTHCRLP